MTSIKTLGESLPEEIKRCQELLIEYDKLGFSGSFGAAMIRQDIDAGMKALAEGDVVAMLRAHEALKGCK